MDSATNRSLESKRKTSRRRRPPRFDEPSTFCSDRRQLELFDVSSLAPALLAGEVSGGNNYDYFSSKPKL